MDFYVKEIFVHHRPYLEVLGKEKELNVSREDLVLLFYSGRAGLSEFYS